MKRIQGRGLTPFILSGFGGLTEAAQKVSGPGASLFGYQNQVEAVRVTLDPLKKDPASVTNASPFASMAGALPAPNPMAAFYDWLDFSLLPSFDKIAKYFHFAGYGGSATTQGLSLKLFAPRHRSSKRRRDFAPRDEIPSPG